MVINSIVISWQAHPDQQFDHLSHGKTHPPKLKSHALLYFIKTAVHQSRSSVTHVAVLASDEKSIRDVWQCVLELQVEEHLRRFFYSTKQDSLKD